MTVFHVIIPIDYWHWKFIVMMMKLSALSFSRFRSRLL